MQRRHCYVLGILISCLALIAPGCSSDDSESGPTTCDLCGRSYDCIGSAPEAYSVVIEDDCSGSDTQGRDASADCDSRAVCVGQLCQPVRDDGSVEFFGAVCD